MRGLSLVVASGGHSLSRPLLLRSRGSRRAGSVVVAHGPSCSAACGIFPDQGSNPCPLHWQADSQPLCHQGSPTYFFSNNNFSDFLGISWDSSISMIMSSVNKEVLLLPFQSACLLFLFIVYVIDLLYRSIDMTFLPRVPSFTSMYDVNSRF